MIDVQNAAAVNGPKAILKPSEAKLMMRERWLLYAQCLESEVRARCGRGIAAELAPARRLPREPAATVPAVVCPPPPWLCLFAAGGPRAGQPVPVRPLQVNLAVRDLAPAIVPARLKRADCLPRPLR